MNIIVNASASRKSGALSIYLQFISHLANFIANNKYYIFVDPSVPQPDMPGVYYIHESNHSWSHRIYWDFYGLKKWLNQKNIKPDIFISFQNTGAKINCRQIVYYHQSIPFYKRNWSFFKRAERILWLYKNIYPIFVKLLLNKKTQVVVQIPYIKKGFIEKFHVSPENIFVLFPDVETIDVSKISDYSYEGNFYHFIYPAMPNSYKEHKTLCDVMVKLKMKNIHIYEKIKIHLTFKEGEFVDFEKYMKDLGVQERFVFEGQIEHHKLLSMYKASQGLLFPSTIETLGLPLLEAAAFGLPIIVSDLDYAHEVLEGYSGVKYVLPYDIDHWEEEIEYCCTDKKRFIPLKQQETSWNSFFKLIQL